MQIISQQLNPQMLVSLLKSLVKIQLSLLLVDTVIGEINVLLK